MMELRFAIMSYTGSSYASGGYPVYVGGRRQVGGGILGSIGRLVLPSLKKIALPLLKKAGKSLLQVGTNVAADALSGRNFKDSLQQHSRAAALNALNSVNRQVNSDPTDARYSLGARRTRIRRRGRQVGTGRITKQSRRKRRKTLNRRRVSRRKSKPVRKRKRRKTTRGPSSKRRKVSYF